MPLIVYALGRHLLVRYICLLGAHLQTEEADQPEPAKDNYMKEDRVVEKVSASNVLRVVLDRVLATHQHAQVKVLSLTNPWSLLSSFTGELACS